MTSHDHQPHPKRQPRKRTGQIRTAAQYRPLKGNGIRVRGKRLDEVDQDRLSLAYWLLAQQLVADETDDQPDQARSEAE